MESEIKKEYNLDSLKISDEEYTKRAKELNGNEKNDPDQEARNIAWIRESGHIPEGDYKKMPKRIQIIGSPHRGIRNKKSSI